MWAAHVPLAHRHGLDAVLEEEVLHLLLDFRVRRYVRGDPALDDRVGTVMEDHASSNLRGRLVVGPYMATVPMGYSGGFRGLRRFISYSSIAACHSSRSASERRCWFSSVTSLPVFS